MNINTASAKELEALPGIGAAKAQAIVEYRTQNGAFKTVDELDKVKGIGPKMVEKLRPEATVGNAPSKPATPAKKLNLNPFKKS